MRYAAMTGGLALALTLSLGACQDQARNETTPVAPTSEAGTLILTLTSPHATDGAVSFEIAGGEVTALRGLRGTTLLPVEGADGRSRVAAVAEALPGAFAEVDVPDLLEAGVYTVRLLEAVDPETNQLRPLEGYHLTLAPR